MFAFKRISTRLAIVYSSLFILVTACLGAVTHHLLSQQAKEIVSNELVSVGSVFSRLISDRSHDIESGSALMVTDFGFRSAVSSYDEPTIASALETLRQRLEVEALAMTDADGELIGQVGLSLPLTRFTDLIETSSYETETAPEPGMFFLDEEPFLTGMVAVRAPDILGWVIFADHIDDTRMAELEALSPIQIQAVIQENTSTGDDVRRLEIVDGEFQLQKPVKTFLAGGGALLTMTYPVSDAMAPFQNMLLSVLIIGVVGLVAVSLASWYIAGLISKPILALTQATKRVRQGELANVAVEGRDELSVLAGDFNHMSNELQAREAEIWRSARIDRETSLFNRRAFEDQLADAGFQDEASFVVSIGIERFGEIRSAIGFVAANNLIRSVASKLDAHPDTKSVAVISGGLLCTRVCMGDGSTISQTLDALHEMLSTTFSIDGSAIDIMVRLGVHKVDRAVPIESLQHSIIALDQAQSNGADINWFDQKKYDETSSNLSLMGDLLEALKNDVIDVAYQPKFDLRTQTVDGVEALVRWNDPERGRVFPDIFIPLAEETGHIEALTYYVINKSIDAQRALKEKGHELKMSINVSGRLIGHSRFAAKAQSQVKDAVGTICFEITETAVIADPEAGLLAIDQFCEAGVEISIDDYGSGLSSLAYLKQLPASELKIDKEFVLNIDKSQRDALLVKSTVDLAHSLGMKITAEGIETENAAALLQGMGCDIGQGYGLARPMPLSELISFLDTRAQDADEPIQSIVSGAAS